MPDLVQLARDKPVLSIGGAVMVIAAVLSFCRWGWYEFAHASDLAVIAATQERHEQADKEAVKALNAAADQRAERTRLYGELRSLTSERARIAAEVGDLETRQAIRGAKPDPADAMIIKRRQADLVKLDAELLETKRALNTLAQPK